MIALNFTTLRANMKRWFDRLSDDQETMIVTRPGENMVILPQSVYDSLMESAWLLGNEANRNHLERSIRQLEAHAGQPHELAEATDA